MYMYVAKNRLLKVKNLSSNYQLKIRIKLVAKHFIIQTYFHNLKFTIKIHT